MREKAWNFAVKLNWLVERICAMLVAILVVDIWFGVLARYVLELGITWTEELARYIMIWAALLAVSCGAHYREHIGLTIVLDRLENAAPGARKALQLAIDLLGIAFFLFLVVYGITMTVQGGSQYAMIFGMTMTIPFASVPVSSALTALQIALTAFAKPDEAPNETHDAPGSPA